MDEKKGVGSRVICLVSILKATINRCNWKTYPELGNLVRKKKKLIDNDPLIYNQIE